MSLLLNGTIFGDLQTSVTAKHFFLQILGFLPIFGTGEQSTSNSEHIPGAYPKGYKRIYTPQNCHALYLKETGQQVQQLAKYII